MTQLKTSYPKKENDNIDINDLKSQLIQEFNQNNIKKINFPTEIITLPSNGVLYSKSSPLSSGTIELKYMTAQEEEILTTQSFIKQGIVLDKLYQSLIVSPIKYNDLVIADKDAIMLASRILGYGKIYDTECTCPNCDSKNKLPVDLTLLEEKPINMEIANMLEPNVFSFKLPITQRVITFKLLTIGDEKKINLDLDGIKKLNKSGVNKELTTRLKRIILSVDDNSEAEFINNFVDNELFAADSKAFREHIKEISPGIDFSINFVCKDCDTECLMSLPIGLDFFWPGA